MVKLTLRGGVVCVFVEWRVTMRLSYLWDYNLSEADFKEILAGRKSVGRLNQEWAAVRLLEYAPYADIVRLLGFKLLIRNWSIWQVGVRSASRRRGLDFLVAWIPKHHPEML